MLTATPTRWRLFECGGGARWSSTCEDDSGQVCSFSGCGCGTVVRKWDTTTDRNRAAEWFRRPLAPLRPTRFTTLSQALRAAADLAGTPGAASASELRDLARNAEALELEYRVRWRP